MQDRSSAAALTRARRTRSVRRRGDRLPLSDAARGEGGSPESGEGGACFAPTFRPPAGGTRTSRRSFDRPQRERIPALDEQPPAVGDGVGVSVAVRHLVAGNFLVPLVAGLEDDQLGPGGQGQQDGAGVDDRTVTRAPAPAKATAPAPAHTGAPTPGGARTPAPAQGGSPGGPAVPGVDAEQAAPVGEPIDQAVLQDRRVELDGVLRVTPELL